MNQKKKSPIWIILLTVFIDMLGVGIIIPVIPVLFFDQGTTMFDASQDEAYRSIMYGLLLACYPFMQFFGAPALGALSDRHGRKPLLMVSLFGTFIGYLLFAYAIGAQILWLLFFSRLLPGFTGGNISIIYSSIADVSTAEEKAKNFGMVGAAFGLGFILGPTIGGIMADNSIVSWFNLSTPFYFTAIITLLNIFLVKISFPETLLEKQSSEVTFTRGFKNIMTSFKEPKLRIIFIVVLLISLGFTFFNQFFAVGLISDFDYSAKDLGLLYAWIGLWIVFTQAFIVRKLSGKVSPNKILSWSILLLAFAVGIVVIPNQSIWFYVVAVFIAFAHGISYPNLTTVISEQAGPERQGEVMGINQSMNSIGQFIPPIIGGLMTTLSPYYPIFTGAVLIFLAWLVFVFIFKDSK